MYSVLSYLFPYQLLQLTRYTGAPVTKVSNLSGFTVLNKLKRAGDKGSFLRIHPHLTMKLIKIFRQWFDQ